MESRLDGFLEILVYNYCVFCEVYLNLSIGYFGLVGDFYFIGFFGL